MAPYRYKCSSLNNFQKEGPNFFAQFLIPGKFRAFKTILNHICVLLVVDELRPPGGSLCPVPPPPTRYLAQWGNV